MKRFIFLLATLLSVTLSAVADKAHYIPNEWKSFNANDTLLYSNVDTKNVYTWSESRSKETDNVIVYWDKYYGSTAPNKLATSNSYYVDIDDLLEKAENFYELECSKLGFVNASTSNVSKYKIMILLNHTTGWICYGGGYDFNVPALWLSPSTCKPVGSAVAHEVGHSFHYMCYSEDSNHGTNSSIQTGFHGAVGNGATIWETTANWQALQSYPTEIFSMSGTSEIYAKSYNYAWTHEWQRYQAYMFLYYLCQKYDGIKTVANVWNHRETSVKDFNQVLMDLKELSVSELYKLHFDFAMHAVTWDLDSCADYRDNYIGNFIYNSVPLGSSKYQVAYSSVPQGTGFNVIPLSVPKAGTTVTTKLTALVPGCKLATGDPAQYLNGNSVYASAGVTKYNTVSSPSARGFRVGYVILKKDNTREYVDDNTIHCAGMGEVTEDISCTVPEDASQMWIVVAPALSNYIQHKWDESFANDDQWPYQVEFVNTNINGTPTIDGRDIDGAKITFNYNVTLKPSSDFSSATVYLSDEVKAALGTAFQLSADSIFNYKMKAYSSSGPSKGQVMYYAANADGSLQQAAKSTNGDWGHWFDNTGTAIGWNTSKDYAFSEWTNSSMSTQIGQYPSRNKDGDELTIRQALKYVDQKGETAIAYFVFNITFNSSTTNNTYELTSIDYPVYTRNVTANSWNTICLPYAATPAEGIDVYTIAGINADKTKLSLNAMTSTMTAGVPYIFQSPSTVAVFNETGEEVTVPVDGANGLRGIYTSETGLVKDGSLILSADKWYKVNNESEFNLGDNCAYINSLNDIFVSETTSDKVILIADDDKTGIGSIKTDSSAKDVYTLNGIRVESPQHGINIQKGKKYIKN